MRLRRNDFWKERIDMYKVDPIFRFIMVSLKVIIAVCIAALVVLFFVGCTLPTKVITVPEVHDHHHWHTDSVIQKDSTQTKKTTTIMQLDSAAMAEYGIQMKQNEKAWLVRTNELERIVRDLMKRVEEKDSVHDSIPVPYPVEKLIPAELTWWQQARLYLANIVLVLIFIIVICFIVKLRLH